MGNGLEFQRLCCLQSVKLLSIFGIVIVAIVLVSQLLALHRSNNDYFQLGNDINGSNWNKESSFKAETDNGKNYSSLGLGFQLGADWFQKSLSNSTLVNDDSGQRKPKHQLALISKLPKSTFHQKQAKNGNFNFSSNIHGPSSISSLLLQNWERSIGEKRSQWHSARERELRNAKFQIENSPIIRDMPQVHASIFRNYSKFRRSYDLMKRLLRGYVYREGEKPIFHQPYLRGIYASEGWFMKLMEENKQFHVKDPKKAHLFYLPFSSLRLREALSKRNFTRQKDLENHLDNFIGRISRKYHFWNRSRGADHFLAACHDWAPRLTRKNMDVCVRALCNSNLGRGFKIGKDVSLPVTYVRSAENPLKDVGGNPASERPVLAFFAGGIHGYLRPILLQYWSNKEADKKNFGPMPRDMQGKAEYRKLMKSSKYCICARGYEVHTPRVVESIHYECVPVIISDNYVPPFFEVFDWESFSVFVLEKDVPYLRNILLSIPEEKYMEMQHRLKIVQQYFLWHKIPVKYDLFHMILHSIWYNRVYQLKS